MSAARAFFSLLLLIRGVAVLILAGCAVAPTEFKEPTPLATADRAALNAQVFAAAWEHVNEKYFDARFNGVDWSAMRIRYAPSAAAALDDETLYRILNQMTGELQDRHVYALSPRRVHEGRSQHLADTGLRERRTDDRWLVVDVVPGSPAEVAGVKRGWFVVSRNGLPLPNEPGFDSLLTYVGQPVRYTFVDEREQTRDLSIRPELISSDATRFVAKEAPGGVRYFRFDYFSSDAVGRLHEEINSHQGAPGMIIDLRHNRGGREIALRRVVRAFFSGRQRLGHTVDRRGKTRDLNSFEILSPSYRGKVVLLTSTATASSAEIFSHVMQFHRRALIVGEQTAGAVEEGMLHRLPGGGYITIAERDYVGLDGQRLERRGVTPDRIIPLRADDLRAGRDPAFDEALSWLHGSIPGN